MVDNLALSSSQTTAHLSPARRWSVLAVLSASLIVITMDMTILNIALPEMSAELRPSSDQQLWIIDVYSLVLAALLVSAAAIGDRWGRKRILLLGYATFAFASLLILVADTASQVIAIRALLGIGGAMIMPTTLSLIRVVFTDAKERATALSIWAAVSGLGAAIGPLVGGFLLEHFSWHAAFLINVPLMALGILAGVLLLPESKVASPGRWDAVAALLSLVGMTALVWSIKEFGKHASFELPMAWLALGVAVVTLTWFVRRCMKSDSPLLELRLFGNRVFSAGIVAALGTTFSMMAALLLLAQWIQLVEGFSPIEAGLRLVPLAVAGAITSLAAPPLARLIGARAVVAGGLALAALGMVLIGIPDDVGQGAVIVALTFIGGGIGSLAIASAMIMFGSPEEKAGNAGALEETAYELGGTLGIALLGSISALMYRSTLTDDPVLAQVDPEIKSIAEESLGAAVGVAQELEVPELGERAGAAFTESLQTTGIIGGVMMFVVAAVVFLMTPKGTDVTESAHA